ncbi:hypothetical protein ACLOJK_019385 [Asimina triloba]
MDLRGAAPSSHALHVAVTSHAMHACRPPSALPAVLFACCSRPPTRRLCPSGLAAPSTLLPSLFARPLPWRWVSKPISVVPPIAPADLPLLCPAATGSGHDCCGSHSCPSSDPDLPSCSPSQARHRGLPTAGLAVASVRRLGETLAGSHGCRPGGDDGAPV